MVFQRPQSVSAIFFIHFPNRGFTRPKAPSVGNDSNKSKASSRKCFACSGPCRPLPLERRLAGAWLSDDRRLVGRCVVYTTPPAGACRAVAFGAKAGESALTFPPSTPWRGEAERRRLNPQLSTHLATTILAGGTSAYGGGLWRPFSRPTAWPRGAALRGLAARFFFSPVSFVCLFGRKSG